MNGDVRKRGHPTPTQENEADTSIVMTSKKMRNNSFLPCTSGTMIYRQCIIEYDGTHFNGFQAQEGVKNARTVQTIIEDAITRTTNEKIRIHGCSRTDKGVHARGQVIAFGSTCHATDSIFRDALNTRLPADVVCRSMTTLPVTEPWYPRSHARGKIYEYIIITGSLRPVHDRFTTWFLRNVELDITRMHTGIQYLVSNEPMDFAAFTPIVKNNTQSCEKGTMCTLTAIDLEVTPLFPNHYESSPTVPSIGSRICLRFHGDRFLYKMVRNLVGTLVEIGRNRIDPMMIPSLLATKDRSQMGQGAPAQGLTLLYIHII